MVPDSMLMHPSLGDLVSTTNASTNVTHASGTVDAVATTFSISNSSSQEYEDANHHQNHSSSTSPSVIPSMMPVSEDGTFGSITTTVAAPLHHHTSSSPNTISSPKHFTTTSHATTDTTNTNTATSTKSHHPEMSNEITNHSNASTTENVHALHSVTVNPELPKQEMNMIQPEQTSLEHLNVHFQPPNTSQNQYVHVNISEVSNQGLSEMQSASISNTNLLNTKDAALVTTAATTTTANITTTMQAANENRNSYATSPTSRRPESESFNDSFLQAQPTSSSIGHASSSSSPVKSLISPTAHGSASAFGQPQLGASVHLAAMPPSSQEHTSTSQSSQPPSMHHQHQQQPHPQHSHPMPPSHAYRPQHPSHHYPQPPQHYHPQAHATQVGLPRHPPSQHHPMHEAPPQAGPPSSSHGQLAGQSQHHHYQQQQHHHLHHHPMTMLPPMPPPHHYYPQHMNMANGPPPQPPQPPTSNGQSSSHINQGRPLGSNSSTNNNNTNAPLHRMSSNGGNSVSSYNNNRSGGPQSSMNRPSYSNSVSSPHHNTKSSWHSDDDMSYRREMIQQIVDLLKRREGSESPEWLRKLPQMVKQLEVALYRSAASFEEYFDKNTLKQRLQSLAKDIATKSVMDDDSKSGSNSDVGRRVDPKVQPVRYKDQSDMHSSVNQEQMKREEMERLRNKQERLLLLHHSSKCNKAEGTCNTPHCREMKQLWSHMSKCENGSCPVPHCYSSRAILSHYRKCKESKCPVCAPVKMNIWKEKNRGGSNHGPPNQPNSGRDMPPGSSTPKSMPSSQAAASVPTAPLSHHHHPSQYPPQHAFPPITSSTSSGNSMPPQPSHMPLHPPYGYGGYGPPYAPPESSAPIPYPPSSPLVTMHEQSILHPKPANTADDGLSNEIKSNAQLSKSELERVRHKQQRLLLLRHASKCDAPEGTCTVTPHCVEMKKLWHHISRCQKNDCSVDHCLSSRYVLIHYRKCKDVKCPSCAPVRDAIKRGYQDKKRKIEPISPPAAPPPISSSITSVSPMPKRIKKEEVVLMPTLINSLTIDQIDTHIKLLNREFKLSVKELKEKCMTVLRILREHESGWVFNSPVDPVELGVPDYFDVIKNPMDLGTINKKLEKGEYISVEDFDKDVRLTFENAMVYNPPDTVVHNMAKNLLDIYCNRYDDMTTKIKMEEDERRHNERACSLCGEEKRLFEPPVFFCSGMNCTNTRIRRQQFFYVSGHAQYNWCSSCYNELDDKLPIELPESQIYKRDLVKKKNNEEPEENWVACDDCERWVHQICGLFNARQNKDADVKYSCPKCLLKNRVEGRVKQTEKLPGAADLPKTNFSEWLENHVNKKVIWKFERLAMEKAQSENIPFEQAYKDITSVGRITIRQVTSTDRKLDVRERMLKRYQHKNYPEQFPYRCKCILVFQELDGIDVLLFALYVYEHGEDNPAPNTRTLYISYLDSVHFMRPPKLRTFVYHEILIAYLDYARRRGFASAHIWACPPMKGDDYIFFAKPADQKTPRDAMLQKWYIDMLTEGQKRGIVGRVTNMYDLYFKPGNDATVVPYLEGDYFSGEIENVIKDVEDGEKAGRIKEKEKKKKSVDKTKKMRKGTRSGGLDDDFIIGDEGRDDGTDAVMTEIGKNFKPMKDSFIVAFLNWEGATPENMQVSKEIIFERERRKREEPDNIVSGNSILKSSEDAAPQDETSKASTTSSNVQNNRSVEKSQIIDDDAEEMDCEILENRQAFLNVCRAPNHYQFDELRRSKHTSMMILWHLHNRDAAKFVPCCFSCGKEILSGIRYACPTCTDFDLCNDCYHNPNANRGVCTHKLLPKAVDGDNGQNPQLTEAQRRDRKNHIKLHIKLLEHSSICDSSQCNSANCKKMKQYLQHSKECKTKQQGGCKVCKRILTLLKYHAQSCKNTKCPIPQCRVIRERIRMMARQQQAMDDRRRQMMNQNFRGKPVIDH